MDNGASSYRRFLDGDESAFDEIMKELFHSLVFFIDRYVHEVHAAEDIPDCKDINNWVEKNADGMIPAILEEISSENSMYLVNALAFDADWRVFYSENEEGRFTREDGERQNVQFMRGTEDSYLEDKKATGFMKLYEGGKCAFVALLPKEGVSVSEYIASLDGQSLNALLKNPKDTPVETLLPKFEIEYAAEMSKILEKIGMSRAFNPNEAEFEGLGTSASGNIFISRILHKTFFSVGEKGTRAGAATIVEVKYGGSSHTVPTKENGWFLTDLLSIC